MKILSFGKIQVSYGLWFFLEPCADLLRALISTNCPEIIQSRWMLKILAIQIGKQWPVLKDTLSLQINDLI